MFLAKKRYTRIKGRAFVDGCGRRGKFETEDAASPTFSIESTFIPSDIDSHEGRDVATINITGAFLHADSYENIIMVLKGNISILMCRVEPKSYRKYIIFDK